MTRSALTRGIRGDLALGLLGLPLLGALSGLVWWLVVDPAVYVREGESVSMDTLELQSRFTADGWFVGIGLVVGIVVGLLVTWRRGADPVRMLVLGVIGAGLAALAAQFVGLRLGTDPGEVERLARALSDGETLAVPLDLTWDLELLAWPVGYLIGAVSVLLGAAREQGPPDEVEPLWRTPADAGPPPPRGDRRPEGSVGGPAGPGDLGRRE